MKPRKLHSTHTEKALHDAAAMDPNSKLMNWRPGRGSPLAVRKYVYDAPEPEIVFVKLLNEREPLPPIALVRPPPVPKRTIKVRGKRVNLSVYDERINTQREWAYELWLPVWECSTLTLRQADAMIHGTLDCSHEPKRQRRKGETSRLSNDLPARDLTFYIDYPLTQAARVTVRPFRHDQKGHWGPPRMTLGYLHWQAARAYVKVYKEHKRYGVWGHHIGDLWFEGLRIQDNVAEFSIGS